MKSFSLSPVNNFLICSACQSKSTHGFPCGTHTYLQVMWVALWPYRNPTSPLDKSDVVM